MILEILVGLLGGIVGGMGMGGGTLTIPLLTIFLNYEQLQAQGINLIAFLPMAVIALIIHFKNKIVDFKKAWLLALVGCLFSLIGAIIANNMDNAILKKMFHTSGSIITKNGKRDRGYSGIAFRKKIIDLDMNMEYEDEEDTFAAEIDDILTENQTDDEWEDEEELELDESLFENPTDDDPDDDETED